MYTKVTQNLLYKAVRKRKQQERTTYSDVTVWIQVTAPYKCIDSCRILTWENLKNITHLIVNGLTLDQQFN